MMDTADFSKMHSDLGEERHQLFNRRTELENELAEVRNKISHLDQILAHIAPFADLPFYDDSDLLNLGITDAVRFVLKHSSEKMTGKEVRDELINKGYDLSSMTAQMASIYKILSRLADSDEAERIKEDGHPAVYYKWKWPPISDEDIPF
jgi:hypothetical protein